jgi:hypothetical protein
MGLSCIYHTSIHFSSLLAGSSHGRRLIPAVPTALRFFTYRQLHLDIEISETGKPPASIGASHLIYRTPPDLTALKQASQTLHSRETNTQDPPHGPYRLRKLLYVLIYCCYAPLPRRRRPSVHPSSSVASSDTVTPRCPRSFASGSALFLSNSFTRLMSVSRAVRIVKVTWTSSSLYACK